ncbi:MAG: hypothetical protein K2J48_07900, partial [Muribaculaceae bacterium]|nr:hypothetical protein [Muribaculaceae bacterium]
HYRSVSTADGVRSSNKWTNYNWNIGLSVSWNFGSLKSDVKRTSTRITNDDKAETGDKKGASF